MSTIGLTPKRLNIRVKGKYEMANQCFVIVSDSGESWALNGDKDHADESEKNDLLPRLLSEGWYVLSVTPGSGAKDDTSYWLVALANQHPGMVPKP